ncbi:MAG: hypothetical protein OHK0039_41260 [Bacteroidia bacterium]
MPRADLQCQLDRLLGLISSPPYRNAAQLADILGVSTRSVASYVRKLRDSDYDVQCDKRQRCYRLVAQRSTVALQLCPQEVKLLQQVLQSVPDLQGLASGLTHQLAQALLPRAQVYPAWYSRVGRVLEQLSTALETSCQVLLIGYRSGNSRVTRDRRVEPLRMSLSGRTLIAYDPEAGQVKYFLITRIEQVQLLDAPVAYTGEAPEPDFFGWGGDTEIEATLALDLYAYNYLLESYPDSEPYICETDSDPDFPFRFAISYRHPDGIGRFILSLPGHIRILAPASLHAHVRAAARWWGSIAADDR